MKTSSFTPLALFSSALITLSVWQAHGQGSIVLGNDASSLVYTNALSEGGTRGLMAPVPGLFFFGLFTAPQGTTDPLLFTFGGAYATNSARAGIYAGGGTVFLPAGVPRAVQVRGWSANLGPTWNPAWASGQFGGLQGFYGQSSIATVDLGAIPPPQPPLVGSYVGSFDLFAIPEPSTPALLFAGIVALLVCKRNPDQLATRNT